MSFVVLRCLVSCRFVLRCVVFVVWCSVVMGRVVSRCVVFRGVVLDAILDHWGYHFDISFSHYFHIGFWLHFLTSAGRRRIENRHQRGFPAI